MRNRCAIADHHLHPITSTTYIRCGQNEFRPRGMTVPPTPLAQMTEVVEHSRSPGSTLPGLIATEAKLPWLFLIYALPSVLVLSIIMPPFQVADEAAHTERADQISRGTFVSPRLGGTIDGGWADMTNLYQPMWFHAEVKEPVEMARSAMRLRWSGPRDDVNFQNTAQYGPLLYAPQVAGLLMGRLLNVRLARALVLARMFNGLTACAVGFFALSICRRGHALMFTTLLLPMTLSEFASTSQDALIISLSILVIAMASCIIAERRAASLTEFAIFALIVVATTIARPSQFALALLTPAFLGRRDSGWTLKVVIGAAAVIAVIIWMRILSGLTPEPGPGSSLSGQFRLMLANPLLLPKVMINTCARSGDWLARTVVGYLGWTDAIMPSWFYRTAGFTLFLALIAPGNHGPALWPGALGLVTVAGLITLFSAALYITWTPVGQGWINGLQGRYILPVLPLLAWGTPEWGVDVERVLAPGWYSVVFFPLVTMAVTPLVIMGRYYGSWQAMTQSVHTLLG